MSATAALELELIPEPLSFRPLFPMDSDEFFAFCQINRDVMMEQTASGEVVIMAPAASGSGGLNAELTRQLGNWAKTNGSGVAFDSSAGFVLPNKATRAPDASWVLRSRLAALTAIERQKFYPLCPDFVVELRSQTDRLSVLKAKMEEYRANGARLGWLIDPLEQRVYVYRSNASDLNVLDYPAQIQGDADVLPNFTLDLAPIWNPGF